MRAIPWGVSVRRTWTGAATWASGEAGDVRVQAIGDTTPLTSNGRVETGERGRRQHGGLMAAGSTTVGGRR